MIGEVYGRLTVSAFSHSDKRHRKWWKCICECGGENTLHTGNLRSGNTRSCGCLKKDSADKRRAPNNQSEVTAIILGYKRHANGRGYVWALDLGEVERLVRGRCFYCGSEPRNAKLTKHSKAPFLYNGIDRRDNSLGYVPGNCVSCCAVCNRAKKDMTEEEFVAWAVSLAKNVLHREDAAA